MATVSFTIPNTLITELDSIAASEGFLNAKALVIHWLQAKVKAYRVNKAKADAEQTAGAGADTDTVGIT